MADRRVRIGIDVGGTFTHAVAIDAATLEVVGKCKVPTTHKAEEGVARGVVQSLLQLLEGASLSPADVLLIAHSTTQATNALLEGDVAPVGIVGVADGIGSVLGRRQTHIRPIELAPGRFLKTEHRFISESKLTDQAIENALDQLVAAGAEVIVAAAAFSVDNPAVEERIVESARQRALPVTATHHVSRLHGLGIRTRTAVINASMIPKMLGTAEMTERAVREAGITAPLMIMRSDGGVMDIQQMRRRPILTMLSGPAAGVAAVLLYAGISDGLFLEVGGTSTDISVIKNGRCQIRTAEIGGQKLHVSTLDVRTVGVAGGSMVYLGGGKISQVGPRSSHIAGLPYLSFTEKSISTFTPSEFDHNGETYLTIKAEDEQLAITPTCASNQLDLVPAGQAAKGKRDVIYAGLELLAKQRGYGTANDLAEAVLKTASPRVIGLVEGLMSDYKLDPGVARLIGGGGGAAAIVPYVAREMSLPSEMAPNADVISAIGVALALVRDTIERTVINPTEEDIRQIREEAFESVLNMGASAETIELFVEVDAKRNLLRATAEGSTEIRQQDLRANELDEAARADLITTSIGASDEPPRVVASADGFEVWSAPRTVPRIWKFFPERRHAVRGLDRSGAIRWASNHADARGTSVAAAESELTDFAEQYTRYTDAGVTIPRCFAMVGGRMVDFSGLVEMKQVLEVLRIELKRYGSDEPCVLLIDRN